MKFRYWLRVLLALTLFLNGTTAPWAMAQMGSAKPGGTLVHSHEGHVVGSREELAPPHHEHHEAAMPPIVEEPPESTIDGACCDGVNCHCGCLLPPGVVAIALTLLPHRLAAVEFNLSDRQAVLRSGNPPFRPPAA